MDSPVFGSRKGKRFFFLFKKSRPALELKQLATIFFPGVKRLEHEDKPSPPTSAEVKNEWSYTSWPPYMPS
jgi:hypothetical protein